MPAARKKTSSKPRGKLRQRERDLATSGVARKFESNIALYTVVVEGG